MGLWWEHSLNRRAIQEPCGGWIGGCSLRAEAGVTSPTEHSPCARHCSGRKLVTKRRDDNSQDRIVTGRWRRVDGGQN